MQESLEAVLKDLPEIRLPASQDRLYALSDLGRDQLLRFQEVWPSVTDSQRRLILRCLGDLARDHIQLNFDRIDQFALSDADPQVRRQAILNLWESEDPHLARLFLEALAGDVAPEVRSAAAQALGLFVYLGELGRMPEDLQRAVEDGLLRSATSDPDEAVRLHGIESLGYSSRPDATALLGQAFASGREDLRRSALVAMGRSANEGWAAEVQSQLSSPSPVLRLEAARAAGELELRKATADLVELLDDVDTDVRRAAIWSLGQVGGRRASAALTRLLKSAEDPQEIQTLSDALDNLAFVDSTRSLGIPDVDDEEEATA